MKNFLAKTAFAVALAPTLAFAHAELLKSDPSNDGTLAPATKVITLTFDETVQPATCKLATADGKDVASIGKPHADGMVLHIPISKPLDGGRYSLACRVVGPDGHPINSTISFTAAK
ncbi:MAG: copper resistance protein CopC [Rhodospirillaceae bacterium]|jgi:methionine-rich copper-binding protein CopC